MDTFSDGLQSIQAVDVDGDGDVDLLGQRLAPPFELSWAVRLNDGSGQFDAVAAVPAASELYSWVIAVDLDGDDDPDLLARGLSGAVYTLTNTGGGAFDGPIAIPGESLGQTRPHDLGVVEGSPQWLVTESTGVYGVWRFRDGMIERPAFPVMPDGTLAGIADLDADGDLDIARHIGHAAARLMAFIVNDGDTFAAQPQFFAPGIGAHFQDLDGDSRGDLWWRDDADGQEGFFVADGAGDGTFGPARLAHISAPNESRLQPIADLNGDGRIDAVVVIFSPRSGGIAPVLQLANGAFEHSTGRGREASNVTGVVTIAADVNGDGRPDLVHTWNDARAMGDPLTTLALSFEAGPSVVAVAIDPNPTVGNLVARITAQPSQPGRTITGVTLYADSNNNGLFDPADERLGRSDQPDGTGRFVVIVSDFDIPTGEVRLFATAHEDVVIPSAEASTSLAVWTRTFYPEGWRNDTTARERVILFNPHDEPVAYRLVARYERGVRDGLIAEGTLQAGQRRVIVVTNPNRPGLARVRKDVGYAIELQSELRLSAMLEHFDTLGAQVSQDGFGALIGEQLTDRTSQQWTLPEVYRSIDQFLLFYNPNPNDVLVRITFFGPDGVGIGVDQLLEPFRRGGLSIKDLVALRRDRAYSVVVTTEVTELHHGRGIVASLTSYDSDNGTGSTSLAYPDDSFLSSDVPIIELGPGRSPRIAVFNSAENPRTIPVRIDFNDGPSRTLTLTIPGHRRAIINPNRYAPAAATTARVYLGAGGSVFATTYDRDRGDSASVVAFRQASIWSFAQAHLAPSGSADADVAHLPILGLGNSGSEAARITVRYTFASGQTVSSQLTIAAGSFRAIPLQTRRFLTDIGGDFSIVVESSRPLTATLSQWSTEPVWGPAPGARGGWWTLGTPLDV